MATERGWKRFLIEGAVIVVSILLAFGIDAWWGGRQEARRETELIDSLRRDMLATRAEADRVLEGNAYWVGAFDSFLSMTREEILSLAEDSARSALNGIRQLSAFTAFDGTIRTADLTVIRSPALRDAISGWVGKASDVAEDPPVLFAAGTATYSAMGWMAQARVAGLETPETTGSSPQLLAAVRENQEFLSVRLTQQFLIGIHQTKVRVLRSQTDLVLAEIEAGRQ